MSISRREIREAAVEARRGQVVYVDGERLTAVEIGDTGKYIYSYMDHPGFTSVAKLVEFVQAGAHLAQPAEVTYHYRDGDGGFVEGEPPSDAAGESAYLLDGPFALRAIEDSSVGHRPATHNKHGKKVFGEKKAERRIRAHRRRLRKSGQAKGISVLG